MFDTMGLHFQIQKSLHAMEGGGKEETFDLDHERCTWFFQGVESMTKWERGHHRCEGETLQRPKCE